MITLLSRYFGICSQAQYCQVDDTEAASTQDFCSGATDEGRQWIGPNSLQLLRTHKLSSTAIVVYWITIFWHPTSVLLSTVMLYRLNCRNSTSLSLTTFISIYKAEIAGTDGPETGCVKLWTCVKRLPSSYLHCNTAPQFRCLYTTIATGRRKRVINSMQPCIAVTAYGCDNLTNYYLIRTGRKNPRR